MSKPTRAGHPMDNLLPTEIEGFDSLTELDIAQVPTDQIVYIENTPMFVQIASGLGIGSILHTDYRATCAKLASFGLQLDEGVIHETG